MTTLLKRTDDIPDLTAAADALAEELSRYETLATGLARERLDSEKHLRRAAQALGELERSEERLGTRVATLVGAINEANARHATSAEAVRRQAIEIRRRGEVLGSLVERWKLLGEAAAQVNALVKTLRDHLPEAAGLAEALADVETQLTALAGEAERLGATAEGEGFADLARQAESLRQQLLSLHGKLRLLRQGSAERTLGLARREEDGSRLVGRRRVVSAAPRRRGAALRAERAGQELQEAVRLEGLRHVCLEAGAEGTRAIARAGVGGDRHGEHVPRLVGERPDPPDEAVPVLAREADVAEEQVRMPCRQGGERRGGVAHGGHLGAGLEEDLPQRLAGIDLVLDEEDARAGEALGGSRRRHVAGGVGGFVEPGGEEGQTRNEGGPEIRAGAPRLDAAPVELDQVADDGEPETEAAAPPRRGAVGLAERLEDVWQEARRDALAGVGDANLRLAAGLNDVHVDAPAGRGELDGVREEVPHHLLEAVGVAEDGDRRRRPDTER